MKKFFLTSIIAQIVIFIFALIVCAIKPEIGGVVLITVGALSLPILIFNITCLFCCKHWWKNKDNEAKLIPCGPWGKSKLTTVCIVLMVMCLFCIQICSAILAVVPLFV